jgi:propanol-preferring alcohol dehydrogenase
LRRVERPVGRPGPGELLVRVTACGVCRTDLHLAQGDLRPQLGGRQTGGVGQVRAVQAPRVRRTKRRLWLTLDGSAVSPRRR